MKKFQLLLAFCLAHYSTTHTMPGFSVRIAEPSVTNYNAATDATLYDALTQTHPDIPTKNLVTLRRNTTPSAVAGWIRIQFGDGSLPPSVTLYLQETDAPSQGMLALGAMKAIMRQNPGIQMISLRNPEDPEAREQLFGRLQWEGITCHSDDQFASPNTTSLSNLDVLTKTSDT